MFLEILKGIVDETGGAVGAVLMGYDGIAVEEYFLPEEGGDLQQLLVELSAVLKEIGSTAGIIRSGPLEEVSIKTGKYSVIMRALSDDYFVALTLECDGNYGKGRYLLMRDAPRLNEALA